MLKYQHTNTTLKNIYKKDFSYKTAITLNNNKKFKRKAKYNKKNKNTTKQRREGGKYNKNIKSNEKRIMLI